ncbi:uncharacterized protein LOC131255899 isoform X2 [Magnolia sinica]|uniref:uncharacterized protein LOC131255899 isoform X2 n=1 Tax=Magnolia sinica TaxID=86752 RepID=UPI002657EAC2|nr:uncharacterized protein LOC131255899 isoform X2 [Magnolia sinica]
MESKEGFEDFYNTIEPKRSRRVSFAADITSVHVFDRDEDFDSPPDSKSRSELAKSAQKQSREGDCTPDGGDLKEPSSRRDGDDGDGHDHGHYDDGDDDEDVREPFVRNMDFSSPGSTVGSAESNDEDNFFGPVSASFIRPGRLSTESANSDDNPDVTMDSTAFSLHFRSLMQSDERLNNSGGNFKTPTGVHLAFEEKTPTGDSMPTNAGSFMVLTGDKKLIPQCMSDGRSSGGGDSNDMSLVVENPDKYNYGRLSPSLDALLSEGQKHVQLVSISNQINVPNSLISPNTGNKLSTFEHRSKLEDLENSGNAKKLSIEGDTVPAEVPFDASNKSCDVDGGYRTMNIDKTCQSSVTKVTLPDDRAIGHGNQTHSELTQGTFSCMDKESCKDTPEAGQSLFNSAGKVGTLSSLDKNFSTDLIMQHDCGPRGYVGDKTGESTCFSTYSPVPLTKILTSTPPNSLEILAVSPKGKRDTPDYSKNADQDPQAPSPESVCSLRSKRERLFHDTGVSFTSEWMSSPFVREQPHSPLNNESISNGGIISSIKNRISKFKTCGTQEVEVETSKPSLLGLADNPCLFEGTLDENIEDPRQKPVDVSVAGVEGHSLDNAEKNTTVEIAVGTHASSSETPDKLIISRPSGDSGVILHDGELKTQMGTSTFSNSQNNKLTAASVSSFEVSGLEKNRELQPLIFHYPIEGTMSTPLTHSPQIQTTAEQKEIKQVAATPNNLVSSSVKRLDQKTSASGGLKGILLSTSNQQRLTDKLVISSPRQQMQDARTGSNAGLLTTISEGIVESSSLLKENREYSTMPLTNINSSVMRSVGKRKEREYMESFLPDLQKELDATGSYQTPLRSRVTLNFHSLSQDRNFQRRMDQAKLGEMLLPERQLNASSCESAPPEVSRRVATQAQSGKNLVGVVQSASWKEIYHLTEGDGLQPLSRKDTVSPEVLQGLREHDHSVGSKSFHILRRSLFIPEVDGSGSSPHISCVEKEQMDDNGRIKQRPKVVAKVGGSVSRFHSEDHVVSSNEADKIGGEASLKHWSDVFSKFSAATEQLLPTSTDKLSTQEIGILEDMVGELQKAKKFEKLCTEIKSQKMHHHPGNLQQQRVAEATWLQHMLMYEQAKLQLLRVKRDRLLKNAQQLQSGIQECRNIQSNTLRNQVPSTRDVQNKERCVQYLSTESDGDNQDAHHKVTVMRKELGVLDEKVKKVIKYFHSACKLRGDPGYDETIVLVNDHLQKRNRCILIHQYLKLWVLDDIGRKDDHWNIVLNYRSLLSQRSTRNDGPISSIISFNLLNDANITKTFPNLDVSTAFEFVFNTKNDHWLGNSKSFRQVTEATSFLFGNLLDVVEEVQIARMELLNLISTSFQSPCGALF